MSTEYALNVKTGRYCKIGSRTYQRALKAGHINSDYTEPTKITPEIAEPQPITPPVEVKTPPPSPTNNIKVQKFDAAELKKLMGETMTDIIKENKPQFKDLTQKQTDVMLKKLLYDKLMIDQKSKKSKKVKAKKPKKKSKYKIREPSSSESSESSESD